MSRAYVSWTNQEFSQVGNRYYEIANKKSATAVEIFMEAQQVLPMERRKARSSAGVFSGKIKVWIKEMGMKIKSPSQRQLDIVTQPLVAQQPVAASDVPPVVPLPANVFQLTELDHLIKRHIDQKVMAFEKSYTELIKQKIELGVKERCSTFMSNLDSTVSKSVDEEFEKRLKAAQPKEAPKAMPKVVILGLHAGQMEIVRKEYAEHLDLQFVTSDESMHRYKSAAEKAHYVCVMRKFISHKHTNAVNKNTHKGFILINGGLTELSSSLLELACK